MKTLQLNHHWLRKLVTDQKLVDLIIQETQEQIDGKVDVLKPLDTLCIDLEILYSLGFTTSCPPSEAYFQHLNT